MAFTLNPTTNSTSTAAVNYSALIAAAGYGCVHMARTTLLNRKNSAKHFGINLKEDGFTGNGLVSSPGN